MQVCNVIEDNWIQLLRRVCSVVLIHLSILLSIYYLLSILNIDINPSTDTHRHWLTHRRTQITSEIKQKELNGVRSPVRMGMCPKQRAGLRQHLLLYTPANLLAILTLLQFKQVDCEFSLTNIRASPANRWGRTLTPCLMVTTRTIFFYIIHYYYY